MEPTTPPSKIAAPEQFEVTAGTVVPGGRCLCRHDGKVVLVAGALPGERCVVRVTRDEKRYSEAEAVEILEPHADRRDAPCEHAAECGGCDWQHAGRDLVDSALPARQRLRGDTKQGCDSCLRPALLSTPAFE